jgi:hypothetical protein
MNAGININKITTNKGKTAFLFLLAILMLVVSCPFKRLLQTENNGQTSQQSVKWNGAERKATTYQNACSCAQKQKITLVKIEISKQKLPAPEFFAEQNLQNGFSIHYFLSGSEKQYPLFSASSPSSLPLFLQHRRLLI